RRRSHPGRRLHRQRRGAARMTAGARDDIHFLGLRGRLAADEPMAQHVSWSAGGRAKRFFAPDDLEDLSAFIGQLPAEEPILFVGLGSNLLVREGGWPGTVIMMYGKARAPRLDEGLLHAEAGAPCPKVARLAADSNLGSAEFLTGIPGTVGGALAMNAGCYGGETWEYVARVEALQRDGTFAVRSPKEYTIGYRSVRRADGRTPADVFTAAWFRFPAGHGRA